MSLSSKRDLDYRRNENGWMDYWQCMKVLFCFSVTSFFMAGWEKGWGIAYALMPKAHFVTITEWLFHIKKKKNTPKDLKASSLTSYITLSVFPSLSFLSNRLLGASDQNDTRGNRQWHIASIPLTDFYPVTLSAGASWIVQGGSNSL